MVEDFGAEITLDRSFAAKGELDGAGIGVDRVALNIERAILDLGFNRLFAGFHCCLPD